MKKEYTSILIVFIALSISLGIAAAILLVNSSKDNTSTSISTQQTTITNTTIENTTPTKYPAEDTYTEYTYKVINEYPHDANAFTQGFVYENGYFYEGTGINGQSSLRKVEIATGNVLQQENVPNQYFGEGIVIWEENIYQLTWQSNIGFIYKKDSFAQISKFNYSTEGWGITHDGEFLIMSDGTSTIYFRDPDTFKEIRSITVTDHSGQVDKLNELEYVNGRIYANIWLTNYIVKINPITGEVTGRINLADLLDIKDKTEQTDVLNGIAYDEENDRLFVTGKRWPKVFEIELITK